MGFSVPRDRYAAHEPWRKKTDGAHDKYDHSACKCIIGLWIIFSKNPNDFFCHGAIKQALSLLAETALKDIRDNFFSKLYIIDWILAGHS